MWVMDDSSVVGFAYGIKRHEVPGLEISRLFSQQENTAMFGECKKTIGLCLFLVALFASTRTRAGNQGESLTLPPRGGSGFPEGLFGV